LKTAAPALEVATAHGSRIVLADGRALIDGIASWWTACHGYNHPAIVDAIAEQARVLPHVMFGGFVHEPALELARRLAALLPPGLDRVFISESGSVSVEIALKIAIQYWSNRGFPRKRRVAGFAHGYHGDTFGTISVAPDFHPDAELFTAHVRLETSLPLPVDDESEAALAAVFERSAGEIAALIVEPSIQGAGGMRFHDAATLARLRRLADRFEMLLIFDEIFTGFGRTGSMFALEWAGVVPDIVTLSKALSGGTLPLAATIARREIQDSFRSDDPTVSLRHGPTYMGNPLACAAANASLRLFASEPRLAQVAAIETALREGLEPCRDLPGVADVRVRGAVGVVEFAEEPDVAALRAAFVERGVWIRPFGQIVYLAPSFTIASDELATLTEAIRAVLGRTLGDARPVSS
jgi:adenosylmethionine-8-amino-7-oxononanoate aminotransferase